MEWRSEKTVYALINKYGLPSDASTRMIIWHNNGPWKRTVVYLDPVPHNFPTPHLDYLAQTIDFKAPIQLLDELTKFDGSLYLDRTAGEATAKCDLEAANFMALNLMYDIVTGKRTAEDARRFAVEIENNYDYKDNPHHILKDFYSHSKAIQLIQIYLIFKNILLTQNTCEHYIS